MVGASGRQRASIDTLKSVVVPNISLETQKKIAGVLSAYDDLIDNNVRRTGILEEISQRLFREWFVNFRFPGYEKKRFIDSDLGNVPESWRICSLAEIMSFQGGAQPPKSEFVHEEQPGYVRLVQIRDFEADQHKCYVADSVKLRKCNEMDIMIARYGASIARICWGLRGAYNVALVRVVPIKPEYSEYLRSYLKDDYFQKKLIGMSGRTAQAGFNKEDIKAIKIAIPDDDNLLLNYQSIVFPLRKLALSLKNKNSALIKNRDFLIPKLITGEVDISELEIVMREQNNGA